MKIYKCEKCGLFLAFIDNGMMRFKARKGTTIKDDKITLKCKCGHITEIIRKEN